MRSLLPSTLLLYARPIPVFQQSPKLGNDCHRMVTALLRSLLFAVLLVANHARAADQTPADTDAAEKRIVALEMRLGGRLGVAALDIGSSRRLEHRAGERFPMCSTFKLLAAAAVLHRVDEKKEQLTRFIPYTKADLLEHAPVTREHVNEGG